ncbi:hypothetical protein FOZ61_001875 [Perkinsus olseni]|uniref:Uncharacterized protein n=1 Tax=Perkinsus olseni TaxID=32597 RepID=A0A7J6LVJ3_PEROL|nr:hypothetical protein FOZ61_001875 [Perkinsus olseni]
MAAVPTLMQTNAMESCAGRRMSQELMSMTSRVIRTPSPRNRDTLSSPGASRDNVCAKAHDSPGVALGCHAHDEAAALLQTTFAMLTRHTSCSI